MTDFEYIGAVEAAGILGIQPASVARLVRKGKLLGRKVGNSWVISRESVRLYQESTSGKGKYDPTRGKYFLDKS